MCLLFSESNHWSSVLAVKNSWARKPIAKISQDGKFRSIV